MPELRLAELVEGLLSREAIQPQGELNLGVERAPLPFHRRSAEPQHPRGREVEERAQESALQALPAVELHVRLSMPEVRCSFNPSGSAEI